MNRERRRHPEKDPAEPKKFPDDENLRKEGPPDEEGARTKSRRHKKVTAVKWNQ